MSSHLWRIFGWQVVRDIRRHPLLALLNVLSVSLGIAVYLAIQIANHGANRSFAATVDLVAGKAQLEVRGEVDEHLWPKIAHAPGISAATGVVEGIVTLPDLPGEYLRILGVDLFSGEPFRTVSPNSKSSEWNLEAWLGQPGNIAIAADFAKAHGLKVGDQLRALANGEIHNLTILTLVETSDSPATQKQRFAMIDLGWAQELFSRPGKLSAIQLLIDHPDRADAIAASLSPLLPANLRAETPRQRSLQLQHMVSAFELNLTALSMVSLLVGVFLIYNTIAAAVIRRRREIGILRSLGATQLEVRSLFLGEAALFGIAGIAFGAFAGVALAQSLTGAVAHTITSLYVLTSIGSAVPTLLQLLTAALFGILAVLIGAWLPASEAARVDPVAALALGPAFRRDSSNVSPTVLAWPTIALGCFTTWAAMHGASPVFGFVSALTVLAAAVLLSPAAISYLGTIASRLASQSATIWRMAADNLPRSASRSGMTVAALSSSVAMLTGLTVMISSFRQTVSAWIEHGIVADLFIAPASNEQVGFGATVPEAALSWLRSRPEVTAVDAIREESILVKIPNHPNPESVSLVAVHGAFRHNLQFQGGNAEAKAERVFKSAAVAVTESFARHFGAHEGDQVTLLSPSGPASFPIAGIYSDYSRDRGAILIDGKNFDRLWNEPGAHSLAVFLKPGASAESLADTFRLQFSKQGEFSIYSNRDLRRRILTVFDQTFAVTAVLRTVAVLVAITGVYLSVTTLATEREREIGILRAIGASRGQIQKMLITEAGLIGFASAALGLTSGGALALLLTHVINPAFFGWTITLHVPWLAIVTTPLWVVAAAALAAWHPAWKAGRSNIAAATREE